MRDNLLRIAILTFFVFSTLPISYGVKENTECPDISGRFKIKTPYEDNCEIKNGGYLFEDVSFPTTEDQLIGDKIEFNYDIDFTLEIKKNPSSCIYDVKAIRVFYSDYERTQIETEVKVGTLDARNPKWQKRKGYYNKIRVKSGKEKIVVNHNAFVKGCHVFGCGLGSEKQRYILQLDKDRNLTVDHKNHTWSWVLIFIDVEKSRSICTYQRI